MMERLKGLERTGRKLQEESPDGLCSAIPIRHLRKLCRVDDLPESVTQEGWVTTLVRGLKKRLAQKLGRNDAFTLWMDYELAGNVPFTPEIMHTLQHSATLLLILSPGYLASKWCQQEMHAFLHTLRERAQAGSSVFIVERASLVRTDDRQSCKSCLGIGFGWRIAKAGHHVS